MARASDLVRMAERVGDTAILVSDSVTLVHGGAEGNVLVCGSHGGTNSAQFAAAAGLKAVVFNDAGIGKDHAGIAGLVLLERFGIAGVAVDFRSARVGDGWDTLRSGCVSNANRYGHDAGVRIGMDALAASRLLARWGRTSIENPPPRPAPEPPTVLGTDRPRIVLADSIAQVDERYSGDMVISGSHGGIVAGRSVKAPVGAAIFNDAGVGKDRAGVSRLAMLQQQRIPAATVAHMSARIGDSRDTYEAGEISHMNALAADAGLTVGARVTDSVRRLSDWLMARPVTPLRDEMREANPARDED